MSEAIYRYALNVPSRIILLGTFIAGGLLHCGQILYQLSHHWSPKQSKLAVEPKYGSRQFDSKANAFYRQAKAERIQHHQTSSSTNTKGSSLDRKHRKAV